MTKKPAVLKILSISAPAGKMAVVETRSCAAALGRVAAYFLLR